MGIATATRCLRLSRPDLTFDLFLDHPVNSVLGLKIGLVYIAKIMTAALRAVTPPHSSVTPSAEEPRARPFLKWVGGKSQLLHDLLQRFPAGYGRYHEPFVGGGAVFFALAPKRAILSDVNDELIHTYTVIRDDVESVIAALKTFKITKTHYYHVRGLDPMQLDDVQRAARMIYLNRTCYNGLYRVNRKGQFNVPFGQCKDSVLLRVADNLRRVSRSLRSVVLKHQDVFSKNFVGKIKRGDLVYFDPPYDPISNTANFTNYAAAGFDRDAQARLAAVFRALADRGVHVVLSNSDTPFIRGLYSDFRIETVMARRAVNRCADRRGPVREVLISVA